MLAEYHNPPFLTNAVALAINRAYTRSNPFRKLLPINFEAFRGILDSAMDKYRKDKKRKGRKSGRPGFDLVLMLKIIFANLILGLSDLQLYGQMEADIRLKEFLGYPKKVPKPSTIWNWRNIFANYRVFEMLFRFDLERAKALFPHVGADVVMIDSSFVTVPRQRNSKAENQKIKDGEGDTLWLDKPAKRRQKDKDAKWTKKLEEVFYGYKMHCLACAPSMLILECLVTAANCHDAKGAEELFNNLDSADYKGTKIFGDSAYNSKKLVEKAVEFGMEPFFIKKASKYVTLTEDEKEHNRDISTVRSKIEHIFGYICKVFKAGLTLRSIGMKRAVSGIFSICWAYNLHRLACLGYSESA